MDLPSIGAGSYDAVDVTLFDKSAHAFTTTSCTITLAPHASTNGSAIDGTFHGASLTGSFHTVIDDAANNPPNHL